MDQIYGQWMHKYIFGTNGTLYCPEYLNAIVDPFIFTVHCVLCADWLLFSLHAASPVQNVFSFQFYITSYLLSYICFHSVIQDRFFLSGFGD